MSLPHTTGKINSKWIKHWNIRCETIKLEENRKLHGIGFGNEFLGVTQMQRPKKQKQTLSMFTRFLHRHGIPGTETQSFSEPWLHAWEEECLTTLSSAPSLPAPTFWLCPLRLLHCILFSPHLLNFYCWNTLACNPCLSSLLTSCPSFKYHEYADNSQSQSPAHKDSRCLDSTGLPLEGIHTPKTELLIPPRKHVTPVIFPVLPMAIPFF